MITISSAEQSSCPWFVCFFIVDRRQLAAETAGCCICEISPNIISLPSTTCFTRATSTYKLVHGCGGVIVGCFFSVLVGLFHHLVGVGHFLQQSRCRRPRPSQARRLGLQGSGAPGGAKGFFGRMYFSPASDDKDFAVIDLIGEFDHKQIKGDDRSQESQDKLCPQGAVASRTRTTATHTPSHDSYQNKSVHIRFFPS